MVKHLITMGVAGCGKTTVGVALAERLNRHFFDGDDYHPRSNVEKMSAGLPLTDEDRLPWLTSLLGVMENNPLGTVISCSALKKGYRDFLRRQPVEFIFLEVSEETVLERVRLREHFFPESLVRDQFATLEAPNETEAIRIDGCLAVDNICEMLVKTFI